jgi:hypothetical protein
MKTLLTFWEEPEDRVGFPCKAFRWTLQVSREDGLWICFVNQHQFSDGKWYDSHTLRVDFGLVWDFVKPKQDHIYYDGPHCHYAVGPFVFNTGDLPPLWENCEKCYGRDY